MDDHNLRQDFLEFVNDSLRVWDPFLREAQADTNAYLGHTYTQDELNRLALEGRTALELNKSKRAINLLSGIQRDNRLSTVVAPVEGSDQQTADLLDETQRYVYDKGHAHYFTSSAFEDCAKVGLSLVGVYPDYEYDRVYGDIKFFNRQYNTFILDPSFTRFDLSDCSAVTMRDFVNEEQARALLPGLDEKEIAAIPKGVIDSAFRFAGYTAYEAVGAAKNLLSYDQYWRWTFDKERVLVDRETGEMQKWPKGDDETEERLKFLVANVPSLELVKMSWRSVEYAVFLGGQMVYRGKDPLNLDRYPFVPIIGFFERGYPHFQDRFSGLMRLMRDAQVEYNKRHSKIIDIMDSVLNTGWIQTKDALVDPDDLLQSGQGRVITLEDNKQIGVDLQPIPPPQVPTGLFQYQDILNKEIMELGGLNASMLGVDDRDGSGNTLVSGRLAEIRASNGLKANRSIFDNFEFSMKVLGDIVLEAIQRNYGPGKIKRITNQEPTQEFYNESFGRYDAQIKQGVLSQSQKDAYYYELVSLKREQIVDVPQEEIIKALPMQNKSDLLEAIQRQQSQAEEMAKVEFEDKRRHDRLIDSQIEGNIATSVERLKRAEADQGLAVERISESQQNQANAILDLVKAASEIDKNTIDQLATMLQLRESMQVEQQTLAAQRRDDVKTEEVKQNAELESRPVDQGGAIS